MDATTVRTGALFPHANFGSADPIRADGVPT